MQLEHPESQKYIKHFIKLGVDAYIIADVMLYNIEVAQTYSEEKIIKQESFYISMLKSFREALIFIKENSLTEDFKYRLEKVAEQAWKQDWLNKTAFENIISDSQ